MAQFALQKLFRVCRTKEATDLCSAFKECDRAMIPLNHIFTGRSCFIRKLVAIFDWSSIFFLSIY